jgi:SET domain-containing protein
VSKKKKKLLRHLANDIYCRIGVSPLHGVGVIAIRKIPKGVNPLFSLVPLKEVEFTPDEIKDLPKATRKQIERFCYCDAKRVMIPVIGLNILNFSAYLNHSKEPNIVMHQDGRYEALRVIKSGEELLMDYDHSFGEEHIF